MRKYRKAWVAPCKTCGWRHHHMITCEDAAAAAEEARASFPPGTFHEPQDKDPDNAR